VPIRTFRHRGLAQLFTHGSQAGIQAKHRDRLRLILGLLDAARQPRDMNAPGLQLHALQGNRAGTWAVKVSGNWRVTFAFEGEDVIDVDYEDYH
jgi:toxin HigB-1